ncbi:hypothetical protein LTR56_000413 [Elasticomyces elasticus]|nr:hypothetical protein LTR56_000413 [Elasticomyces elasticus]KAK3666892.1 hypothetical protein LTR22_002117 [Elasticomyces elasticus]KAK4933407.1 hypothetical protein LTR49_000401 [Elasticomyces elasticus]KAK5755502.1 hypothetical protein LTS12_014370 [Elasticomyces elasticus]
MDSEAVIAFLREAMAWNQNFQHADLHGYILLRHTTSGKHYWDSAMLGTRGNGSVVDHLALSDLLHVLEGVTNAVQVAQNECLSMSQSIMSHSHSDCGTAPRDRREVTVQAFSFPVWLERIDLAMSNETHRQLAKLALALADLRQRSRKAEAISANDLDRIWTTASHALLCLSRLETLPQPSRSAQGFLAVPLCSLLNDGRIDELLRLHVWLPDGKRGTKGFEIHSHQPFAQSWVLAGEGKDQSFEVEPVPESKSATHAKYALAWSDGKDVGTAYKTHQLYSKIVNTGEYVCAHPAHIEAHTRNMSYTVPAASFHQTLVAPETFHATLFYFDASRGFVPTAPVLGPVNDKSSTQLRDSAGIPSAVLVAEVDAVRTWEQHVQGAAQHAHRAEWELALQEYTRALDLPMSNNTLYQRLTLDELSTVLHIIDDKGHGALDHAVARDDFGHEQMILDALRLKLDCPNSEATLHYLLKDARLRKHYAELFHTVLLPKLSSGRNNGLPDMRYAYAETLIADNAKGRAFDKLKYVRYADLVRFGRFPRHTDGLTQEYDHKAAYPMVEHIIFISYRWVNTDPWTQTPDNAENTQYKRVVKAAAAFLDLHPSMDAGTLGVWIDYACIDQDQPMSGIAALPMVLAQCDALISLVDDEYHDRAWCTVEVMMAQALQNAYRQHLWFEHFETPRKAGEGNGSYGMLREGPRNLRTTLADKRLRFEEDRWKIHFLERQINVFQRALPAKLSH